MISDTLKKFADRIASAGDISVGALIGKNSEKSIEFTFAPGGHIDFEPLIAFARKLLPVISQVVNAPVTKLNGKLEIKRAESSLNLTPLAIRETMRDMRLWKLSENGPKPEKVYSSVNVEELNVYENRVIKALIDRYVRLFSSLEQGERSKIKTLYGRFSDSEALSRVDIVRLLSGEPLGLSKGVQDNRYLELSELRKKFMRYMRTDFYQTLNEVAQYRERNAEQTMIFSMNEKYFRCLQGWRYLNKFERSVSGLDADKRRNAYTCFIALSLISAYFGYGFEIVNDCDIKNVYENFSLHGLRLKNECFSVNIEVAEDKIYVVVECPEKEIRQSFKMGAYADDLIPFEKDEQFVFSPHFKGYGDRYVYAVTDEGEASQSAISAVARMTVFTASADRAIYSRVCPVCGSAHIGEGKLNFTCEDCGASYLFLDDNTIWINGFSSYKSHNDQEN